MASLHFIELLDELLYLRVADIGNGTIFAKAVGGWVIFHYFLPLLLCDLVCAYIKVAKPDRMLGMAVGRFRRVVGPEVEISPMHFGHSNTKRPAIGLVISPLRHGRLHQQQH